MLVPFLPNTSMSGGQTRWFNIIKFLSKNHEITLFSLIKDESEKRFVPDLEKYCERVEVFRRPKSPWTFRNIFFSIFSAYPLLVVRNFSWAERMAIRKILKEEKFDLIHAETFYVMPHIPKIRIPSMMVEQTIEYQVYKHYVDNEVPLLLRPIFMWDVMKLKFWEKHYWRKADRVFAVSSEDKKVMQELIPGLEVGVIPNGVDADYYAEKKLPRKSPPCVMYGVTNFEWLQNVEAVRELVTKVWPGIIAKVPGVRLWIVGRMIPSWIKEMSEKRSDIFFTESIEDARDAYGSASLMVTPIRGSGGTRLKVLEAMAAALPIVSTRVGVAGLGLEIGKQAMISDSSRGLAEEAVNLLKNPKKAKKIGLAGREFVKNNFDWKAIVNMHDEIYKSLVLIKK